MEEKYCIGWKRVKMNLNSVLTWICAYICITYFCVRNHNHIKISQYKKCIDLTEQFQHMASKGVEYFFYENRLRELEPFDVEKRRLRAHIGSLIYTFISMYINTYGRKWRWNQHDILKKNDIKFVAPTCFIL